MATHPHKRSTTLEGAFRNTTFQPFPSSKWGKGGRGGGTSSPSVCPPGKQSSLAHTQTPRFSLFRPAPNRVHIIRKRINEVINYIDKTCQIIRFKRQQQNDPMKEIQKSTAMTGREGLVFFARFPYVRALVCWQVTCDDCCCCLGDWSSSFNNLLIDGIRGGRGNKTKRNDGLKNDFQIARAPKRVHFI